MRVKKKLAFLLFASFGLIFFPQLNVKAADNLKTPNSGIIVTPWAMFVPISAFLLFLVSQVACGENLTLAYVCCLSKFCHN